MDKIVAITYYRFDEDYLEDYKKNLAPLVDDFLIVRDDDGGLMYHEAEYRTRLYKQAYDQGARWAVVIDPDERLERKAPAKLRKLIAAADPNTHTIFRFNFRELYTPDKWRCDGVWGKKERHAVFELSEDNIYSDASLHFPKHPLNPDYRIVDTGLNIYHLKHIDPALRVQRRDLYEHLDPDHKLQSIGYDYLTDEENIEFKRIPFGHGYLPPYRDYHMDEGLFDLAKG